MLQEENDNILEKVWILFIPYNFFLKSQPSIRQCYINVITYASNLFKCSEQKTVTWKLKLELGSSNHRFSSIILFA